jgi:hypothetical protein
MSIDTSKMSKGKAAALDIAEAARDEMKEKSLAGGLFVGELNLKNARPFPKQSLLSKGIGRQYINEFWNIMKRVDADEIDRTGEIPDWVFEEFAKIGAFAIKVPGEYGGRELSQMSYSKAAMVSGIYCGNIAALLSAHQSIGVPQPLLMYGTREQKRLFLPLFAEGQVSAFALTEMDVGSDPSKLTTTAELSEDGEHYTINGEKLWCTNGTKASVIAVMARTGKKITAFIVEMDRPGVEVTHRSRFMGLKALYNGVIKFTDVKVPKENIILAEGKGMRVALNTLNIGRLTIPAICVGASKECLRTIREWTSTRSQWGQEIGKHQMITDKLARMAADTYAMEAMVELCANLVDRKNCDIRVESAMSKMWATEAYWTIVDNAMQMKSGRAYETDESLVARGEKPDGIERMFRDARINLIFEGSSEIMRLILAREALDPHLKVAGDVLNSKLPWSRRIKAAVKAGLHYAWWYPKQWIPTYHPNKHSRYVRNTSKKLARTLFHSMLRHGPGLDKQQLLLSRLTEIGTELFVVMCALLKSEQSNDKRDKALADAVFRNGKIKIKEKFAAIRNNNDQRNYKLGRKVLDGDYKKIERVIT